MMKNKLLALAVVASLAGGVANAAEKKTTQKTTTTTTETRNTDTVTSTHSYSARGSDGVSFGLGYAATTVWGNSISAMLNLNDQLGFQFYAGIPNTAGSVSFDIAAAVKYSLLGGWNGAGFHLGGGFGVSFNSSAASGGAAVAAAAAVAGAAAGAGQDLATIWIAGLAGPHFRVADKILIQLDGGPVIGITKGSTNFNLGAPNAQLGASVHYMF